MEIIRNYAHRVHGVIGQVVFVAPEGDYTLDGNVLPEVSVSHLLRFALQTLQDAYAGATTPDECVGAFGKKLDAIINGTLGARGSSDGVDPFVAESRLIVRPFVKASMGAKSPAWAAFTGLTDNEQDTKLDKVFADNDAKLRPLVEAAMERKARERADKATLKGTVSVNI